MAQHSTLVIKLGGAEGIDPSAALDDVGRLAEAGRRVVLVHGGSAETDRLARDVGHGARSLQSPGGHTSRYTDPRTLELFVMATALVNRRLVGGLQARGVDAAGLSGLDGATLQGERKGAVRHVENGRMRVIRDDWSGRIRGVDPGLLQDMLEAGRVPVLAPLAMTERGEPLNVDGDRAAAAVAGALGRSELVILTGVPGLMRSFPDPASLVEWASASEMEALLGYAKGRMKRKVLAAQEALDGGVSRVAISAAEGATPVWNALDGAGTTIVAGAAAEVTR